MFPKDALSFLAELETNNNKKWFESNKNRYDESVLDPALELVAAMDPRLKKISKNLVAIPKKSGGSLTRIYRDVRFSKDKSPYNTHVTMMFHHEVGKKVPCPGFYLRLTADEVRLGTGLWQPDTATANLVRELIAKKSNEWTKAVTDPTFKKFWKNLDGESLKRPPKGFDPDHELIEDLKRKDFVSFLKMNSSAACRKDFPDKIAERYAASKLFMKFICKALELKF